MANFIFFFFDHKIENMTHQILKQTDLWLEEMCLDREYIIYEALMSFFVAGSALFTPTAVHQNVFFWSSSDRLVCLHQYDTIRLVARHTHTHIASDCIAILGDYMQLLHLHLAVSEIISLLQSLKTSRSLL